ncbi:MAG: replication initiator protein A, partial [Firmicutes bacterium]|nr:replication initiator protein A [Bacillota bacterium]
MREMNFNYYYGNEAEQFNFYRIPKVLFTDERFAKISVEAKVLYGLMLDRMCLSVKNGWLDEENRVYIYFKLEEVMEHLNIGKDKCLKLFSELDVKNGIGLIQRKKQGLGKPAMIYVMNFTSNMTEVKTSEIEAEDNSVSAKPKTEEHRNNADCKVSEVRTSEKPKSEIRVGDNQEIDKNAEAQTSENPTSRVRHSTEDQSSEIPKSELRENRSQEFGFSDSNDTNINNT